MRKTGTVVFIVLLAQISAAMGTNTQSAPAVSRNKNDCGAYALYRVLDILSITVDYSNLRKMLGITDTKGTSLLQIHDTAKSLGAIPDPVQLDVDTLIRQEAPCILFVRGNHFIAAVAYDYERHSVYVLDQNKDAAWMDVTELVKIWKGEAVFLRSSKPLPAPRLWVDSFLLDSGRFHGVNGESRTVTILNTGDVALELGQIEFSCDCVKIISNPQVIPPHRFGNLGIKIDTSSKRQGKFSVRMFIHTNQPNTDPSGFDIRGVVDRALMLNPSYFSLGDINPSVKRVNLTSRLILGEDYDGDVSVKEDTPGLTWVSAVRSDDGASYEIKLILEPAKAKTDVNGNFFENLFIATKHPMYQFLELGVRGRRLPCLSVMPKQLFIQQCRPGETIRRYIKVASLCVPPSRVVTADPSLIHAHLESGQIIVDIISPLSEGPFQTHLKLVGSDITIPIPISGIVTRSVVSQ